MFFNLVNSVDNVPFYFDWTAVRADVQRFLPLREQEGLRTWSADFFLHFLARMNDRETPFPLKPNLLTPLST
jgi:hypothetical protein